MFTMPRKGIVNVKMVITEEKILSNIEKVTRIINPDSKKQIIELDDNSYFKDLIESIKTYLIEYPKKKNFPKSVYDAAFSLVEYATKQFDENTKKVEALMKQREINTKLGAILKQTLAIAQAPSAEWQKAVINVQNRYSSEIINALNAVGFENGRPEKSLKYKEAVKLINARISNLETNLHIEIDLERIEDKSKALSYIGIEIADALKAIPAPRNSETFKAVEQQEVIEESVQEVAQIVKTPQVAEVARVDAISEEDSGIEAEMEKMFIPQRKITTADIMAAQNELMQEETKQRQQVMQAQQMQQARIPQQLNVPRYGQVINPQGQNTQTQYEQQRIQQQRQMQMQQARQAQMQAQLQAQRQQAMQAQQAQEQRQPVQQSVYEDHVAETTKEVKPTLWERFKNTKFARAFTYLFRVRVVLQLPEGQQQENQSR